MLFSEIEENNKKLGHGCWLCVVGFWVDYRFILSNPPLEKHYQLTGHHSCLVILLFSCLVDTIRLYWKDNQQNNQTTKQLNNQRSNEKNMG